MGSRCKVCGSELQPSIIPSFTGKHRAVQVTFNNAPVRVCPNGHEKRMPDGEYGFYLLESILKNTPMSNPKGLAKKQYLCIKCSQPLDVDRLQPQQFQVSLGWKDAQPFSAILDGPSAMCGSCMTIQMLKTREVERDEIPSAIANAFDSIGLKR